MTHYPSAKDNNIDGSFSWQNKVNLQHYLQNVGYYSKNRECDGDWGYWTTLAIQQFLRTKYRWGYPKTRMYAGALDGKFGNMTKKAMGDAAGYLIGITGKPSYMSRLCGAGSCTVAWPNKNVVKQWQQWLNYNR
ncbi:hypothetical protein ACTXJR_06030 [Glutamicibacter ardleyensis]|uniref:hypothetical protein n=1 Tax=Glutamicibacter ardleyensis TaxID=225894 RepID=UPI003FD04EA5